MEILVVFIGGLRRMKKTFSGALTSTKIFNEHSTHTPVNKQAANLVGANKKVMTPRTTNYCEICNVEIKNVSKHLKTKSHIKSRKLSLGIS